MFTVRLCLLIIVCNLSVIVGAELKGFDDTVLFKINWPGKDGLDLIDREAEPLVVTTENNERYKCLLPHIQEKEKDPIETYSGPNPYELLEPLFTQTSCSYRLESYWTYELCHGKYVRQYHEEREGKKVKTQEYYLGRLNPNQIIRLGKEWEQNERERQPGDELPVKKIDSLNLPYLAVNMTDGTLCDLSQRPRVTNVLYVCFTHGKHEVYSLKEISTCEYEIIVLSPFLCQHPKFKPQESGENIINCHPLDGSPKKPKNLLVMEAESLKLRHQKVSEEKAQKVYAIFSIEKPGDGQEGEAKVRVEIHPVEHDETELTPPGTVADTSPVTSFLSGKNCLSGGSGWWKYEFCYGISVDQFHVEKDGTRTVVHLGKFNKEKHLEWIEKNPHKRPKPLSIRRQISHLYSDGSPCDKTGRPRQTEVKLKCLENNSSPGAVALYLLEPKTCEYILGIESPLICNILASADENGLIETPADASSSPDEMTVTAEGEDTGNHDSFDNTIANGDE